VQPFTSLHPPNCVASVFMMSRHVTVGMGAWPKEASIGAANATGVPNPLAPAYSTPRTSRCYKQRNAYMLVHPKDAVQVQSKS
jgi:hypothetical protein